MPVTSRVRLPRSTSRAGCGAAGRRPRPVATAPGGASKSVRSRTPAPAAGVARLCRCRGRHRPRAGRPLEPGRQQRLDQCPQVVVHDPRPSTHTTTNGRIVQPVTLNKIVLRALKLLVSPPGELFAADRGARTPERRSETRIGGEVVGGGAFGRSRVARHRRRAVRM